MFPHSGYRVLYKKSAVYLKYQLRNSKFPLSANGQTYRGNYNVASLLKIQNLSFKKKIISHIKVFFEALVIGKLNNIWLANNLFYDELNFIAKQGQLYKRVAQLKTVKKMK